MTTHCCSRCGQSKPASEMARHSPGKLRTWCRGCDAARSRSRYDLHREIAIEVYGGRCEWCGTAENLEFDHANDDGGTHREREGQPSMLHRIALSAERLEDYELRLLCTDCHRGPGWKERRLAHAVR